MHVALSQVSSLRWPFEEDVEQYAAVPWPAIELWLTKLEDYLQTHSASQARQLLESHHVAAPVASLQGGLLSSQGPARQEAWNLLGRRLELCAQLGVGVLVVACDVAGPLDDSTIQRVHVSLAQLADEAARHGIDAALEFQSQAALGNNLQTAAAMVEQVGHPHLGLCLDAFHYYTGPSKPQDLDCLTRANLFHVQLCDLAGVPRELAADSDRILPGDGEWALRPIIEQLERIGYQRWISVELMNPRIGQVPPLQLGQAAMSAVQRLLGMAAQ